MGQFPGGMWTIILELSHRYIKHVPDLVWPSVALTVHSASFLKPSVLLTFWHCTILVSPHISVFFPSILCGSSFPSNKYFSRIYYVQGIILGVENAIVNRASPCPDGMYSLVNFPGLSFK